MTEVEASRFRLYAEHDGERVEALIELWHPTYEGVRLARSMGEADPEASALRFDAVTTAIREILNRACHGPDREAWASGAIELLDPSGEVIHSMPAKEDGD